MNLPSWTLTICLLLQFSNKLTQQQHMISLNGLGWKVHNANGSIQVPAQVPGGIYTDLKRNNVLKQDIFFGKNDLNYRWVAYDNWTYTLSFITSDQVPASNYVNLVTHGLDTVATVMLNGQLVGTAKNMFVRYKFDIKPYLRVSGIRNNLEITFGSPVKYATSRSNQSIVRNKGKIIPPYCPSPAQRGECHVNFIRKMQASFSWDWGPAFPSMGIYRPIFIEFGNFGIIRDLLVETKPLVPLLAPTFEPYSFESSASDLNYRPASPFLATNSRDYNSWFRETGHTNGRSQLSNMTSSWYNSLDDNWALKVTLVAEMPVASVSYSLHLEFDLDNRLHYESDHLNVISNSEGIIRLGFNLRIDKTKMRTKTWWPNNLGQQPLYTLTARMMPLVLRQKPPPIEYPGEISPHMFDHRTDNDEYRLNSLPSHYAARNGSLIGNQKDDEELLVNYIRTIDAPEMSEKSVRIGFRTIELVQEPIGQDSGLSDGLSFHFRVNGVNVFAMGSNWIPAHVLPELSADAEQVKLLLKSAKEANMNMLRIWGGGLYESDLFYELADEMGLMLWQDLMFACALYPNDDEFLASVGTEVEQQVQRLQHHPSIAVWGGNNENEMAIAGPWWVEVTLYPKMLRTDYGKLVGGIIMPRVKSLDQTRPFLTSSPGNGLMSENQENFVARYPNDPKYGDIHHYDYASDAFDWTVYPSNRFASEYGLQSYPSFSAIAQVTNASDWRYPFTSNIIHRQHRLTGEIEIYSQVASHFPVPEHGGVDKFKSYLYLTQLTQAIGVKTQSEFYRRNRAIDSKGQGFTMGALYWQLNDVWQGPSWSSIEFGGKWKMLHYFARRFFFPINVVPYLTVQNNGQQFTHQLFGPSGAAGSSSTVSSNEKLVIDFIRDDLFDRLQTFNVTIRLYRWSSFSPIWGETITLRGSSPQNVSRIYEQDMSKILNQAGLISSSGGVFRVSIDQQPKFGLSEIENYLLPVAPVKITGMRVPLIVIESIRGPFDIDADGEILTSNHMANGQMNSNHKLHESTLWMFMFRITLRTDAIAMFVWLDMNIVNSPYLTNQSQLDGKHNYKVHPMPVKFRFSDNAFNMFETHKVVDIYFDRIITGDQLQESLEIRSMANSF